MPAWSFTVTHVISIFGAPPFLRVTFTGNPQVEAASRLREGVPAQPIRMRGLFKVSSTTAFIQLTPGDSDSITAGDRIEP